jgi:type II secretory pathway component PulL
MIADIKALVSDIVAEGNYDVSAKVTISAPSERVFYQRFKTDVSVGEEIQRLIKYELEDDLPIPFDKLIAGICGSRSLNEDDREYLVGAINRNDLQEQIDIMKRAQLKCSSVTTDVCALKAVASVNCDLGDRPYIIIHSSNSKIVIAIIEKGKLVRARHFECRDLNGADGDVALTTGQVLIREIEITLRSVFGSYDESKLKVLIVGNSEFHSNLSVRLAEATDYKIVTLNPFERIDCPKQRELNSDVVTAIGLSLMGINEFPEALNFLEIDENKSDQTTEAKRGLLFTGVLILVIGVLLLGKLFYDLNKLEKQHELVKSQIREVFVDTLPEEKKIVNELAQMSEQLDNVQEEYNTLTAGLNDRIVPLKILQIISEKITPEQNVRINDIFMEPGKVRFAGVASSFESVDKLMAVLHKVPEFETIETPNIDVDSRSSGVRFTLLITTVSK